MNAMSLIIALSGIGALVALFGMTNLAQPSLTSSRLKRFVPIAKNEFEGEARLPGWIRLALSRFDPTFAATQKSLQSVGISHDYALAGFAAARLIGGALVAVFAYRLIAEYARAPMTALAGGACGFILTLYLANKLLMFAVQDLRGRVMSELFFAIDLLVIFLESGQSLDQSLHSLVELGQHSTPHTSAAHQKLVRDLGRGMQHDKAFAIWASRLGVDQARDLSVFFIQSLVHGVELGPQLRRFADEIMERRLMNARARVGSKSARLTVIMVLFFLPAILIILAGPPVVSLMRHMGG